MKILTYNIGNGARRTLKSLIAYVNLENPDILCIQEANEWQDGSPSYLEQFARGTGFKHWEFGKSKTGFNLIIFSKTLIVSSHTHLKGFWHSAVHAEISYANSPLHIWNVHLDPKAPEFRIEEIKKFLSLAKNQERLIVTGDLNSIKSTDPYPPNLLEELHEVGITKFGRNSLSFTELEMLTSSGFVDMMGSSFDTTVPTPYNKDANHAIGLRLDYILASSNLSSRMSDVGVVKNIMTDEISDHYPVRALLN